jgi:hypothetical protein
MLGARNPPLPVLAAHAEARAVASIMLRRPCSAKAISTIGVFY